VQTCEQPINENEVTEVIDDKVLLDAIDKLPFITATAVTGIADHHIDRRMQLQDRIRAVRDGIEIAEIELQR